MVVQRFRVAHVGEHQYKEYDRLHRRDEELEEPKRYYGELSDLERKNRELAREKCDHTQKDNPSEHIPEETKGEREDFCHFADPMEPSYEDIEKTESHGVSGKIKEVTASVADRTACTDRDRLRYDHDENRHDECRVEVAINGADIRMEPAAIGDEDEPVDDEAKKITQENEDEESGEEEEKLSSEGTVASDEVGDKVVDELNGCDSYAPESGIGVCRDRSIQERHEDTEAHHENPCRNDGVGNGYTTKHETIFSFAFECGHMEDRPMLDLCMGGLFGGWSGSVCTHNDKIHNTKKSVSRTLGSIRIFRKKASVFNKIYEDWFLVGI